MLCPDKRHEFSHLNNRLFLYTTSSTDFPYPNLLQVEAIQADKPDRCRVGLSITGQEFQNYESQSFHRMPGRAVHPAHPQDKGKPYLPLKKSSLRNKDRGTLEHLSLLSMSFQWNHKKEKRITQYELFGFSLLLLSYVCDTYPFAACSGKWFLLTVHSIP